MALGATETRVQLDVIGTDHANLAGWHFYRGCRIVGGLAPDRFSFVPGCS
jgi:hypothetical protein